MVRTARLSCCLSATLLVCLCTTAFGQRRIQFPSAAIPTNTAPNVAPGAGYGATSGAYSTAPATLPQYGSGSRYIPPASQSYGSGDAGNVGVPNYGAAQPLNYAAQPPNYGATQPGTYNYNQNIAPSYDPTIAPSYGPGVAPGPEATFQGGIQPMPTWDPYGAPGSPGATIFPNDPTLPPVNGYATTTIATMQRFLQQVGFEFLWMPGTGEKEFGINDVDLFATFALPFCQNPQTPFLITPGVAVHYWNGPDSDGGGGWIPAGNAGNDVPPRVYDAYLNVAWNPQFSSVVGAELDATVGVFSDFERVVDDSLRYFGSGLAVISFSPSFQVKAGVAYLGRQNVKLLPAGGIVWTPNPDVRLDIVFPYPKLSMRLPGYSTTEWWVYLRGEYGGGTWSLRQVSPEIIRLDYNDMRCALGLDFQTVRELKGLFEVGIAFERELFVTKTDRFTLDPTVFLRAGLAY